MPDGTQAQLKRGVLEMCVLALLSRADNYAYDIASQLATAIGMGEGTIYPLLRRMQTDGLLDDYLVDSPAGPPRRYYRVTKAGQARLKQERAIWDEFSRSINSLPKASR